MSTYRNGTDLGRRVTTYTHDVTGRPFASVVSVSTIAAANMIVISCTPPGQKPIYIQGNQAQDLLAVSEKETPLATATRARDVARSERGREVSDLKRLAPVTAFGTIATGTMAWSMIAHKMFQKGVDQFQNGMTAALSTIAVTALVAVSVAGAIKCVRLVKNYFRLGREEKDAQKKVVQLTPGFEQARSAYEERYGTKYPGN